MISKGISIDLNHLSTQLNNDYLYILKAYKQAIVTISAYLLVGKKFPLNRLKFEDSEMNNLFENLCNRYKFGENIVAEYFKMFEGIHIDIFNDMLNYVEHFLDGSLIVSMSNFFNINIDVNLNLILEIKSFIIKHNDQYVPAIHRFSENWFKQTKFLHN